MAGMNGPDRAPGMPAGAGQGEGLLPRGYELRVLVLLGLAYGFAYFDRMAMTFLSPFVQADLSLSNTEIGALGSGLSVTWALGAYFVGRWSDSLGRRKPFLLAALVVFSFCSVMSGLAWNFGTLFATRVVMGAAEGPFLPICLAIMVAASADSRKGLNAGIVQNVFGAILGTALAPKVLVWIATEWGWREAFFISGIPGLILAVLIWRFVSEPERPAAAQAGGDGAGGEEAGKERALPALQMLAQRNIAVCAVVSCFAVGSAVIGSIFMPLYLDGPRDIDPATWSTMMAVLGFAPAVGAVVITALSDRIGRKPPVVIGGLMMAIGPLALLHVDGSPALLAAFMCFGWLGMGIFPLFMGVIPAETLGRAMAATAMGVVVAVGELTGGVFGPIIAGSLADNYTLDTALWLQTALALCGGIAALALKETNPRMPRSFVARATA